jgi:putative FmdB family regulatory protein
MPIFEFKCTKCEEFFEVIVMGSDEKEINCPKCKSEEFQRVVSKTNYNMGTSGSGGGSQGVHTQERSCSGGSCKTYTVPGV